MKFWSSIILLAFVTVTTIAQEKNLQCYVCESCDELTDAMLSSCGPDTTPPPPTTTTQETQSTIKTTDDTTVTSVTTDGQTTLDPISTTEVPSTIPTLSNIPETAAPTIPEAITTAITEIPTPTTTVLAETEPPTTNSVAALALQVSQVDDASVVAVAASSLPEQPSPAAILIRNYRSISRVSRADVVSYACYKIDLSDNESDSPKWKRGCVAVPEEKDGCQVVREQNGLAADSNNNCRHCITDGCNGSAALKISLGALLAALVIKFLI